METSLAQPAPQRLLLKPAPHSPFDPNRLLEPVPPNLPAAEAPPLGEAVEQAARQGAETLAADLPLPGPRSGPGPAGPGGNHRGPGAAGLFTTAAESQPLSRSPPAWNWRPVTSGSCGGWWPGWRPPALREISPAHYQNSRPFVPQIDPTELEALAVADPEVRPAAALLLRTAEPLAQVLAGQLDPLELLFPGGSTADAEALYGQTAAARYYNRLIATALEAWQARHPQTPLRILEVGGGTGGTTAELLAHLPAEQTRYLFTDLSTGFLNLAESRLASQRRLEYRTFDLQRPPAQQGFDVGGQDTFDIILAANVLHATADLHQTLAHLESLLAPGGWLVALELTDPPLWVELTFGLTDGWWHFADDLRHDQPLLAAPDWLRLLAARGFQQATALPDKHTPLGTPRQHLLLAQKPNQTIPEPAVLPPRPLPGGGVLRQRVARWSAGSLPSCCAWHQMSFRRP